MSRATLKAIQAAAGNAGETLYVEDLFSADSYYPVGYPGTTSVTTGLDISGEGGMIFFKRRDGSSVASALFDSARGFDKMLTPSSAIDAENTGLTYFSSVGSDGYVLNNGWGRVSSDGAQYVSWSFRKQPGFFDIVTYTGTNSTGTISHNLNATVGMIVIKKRSGQGCWAAFVRSGGSAGSTTYNYFQTTTSGWGASGNAEAQNVGAEALGYITSTGFDPQYLSQTGGIGSLNNINDSGQDYIAYIWAHDAQEFGTNSDEAIIKCGSYTGGGISTDINLGFEPQFLIIKNATNSGRWWQLDMSRGIANDLDDNLLAINQDAEILSSYASLFPTGFQVRSGLNSAANYSYVAIRRPQKPASKFSATELFYMSTWNGSSTRPAAKTSGWPVDFAFWKNTSGSSGYIASRLLQGTVLFSDSATTASISTAYQFDYPNGYLDNTSNFPTRVVYMWRRAPESMDVVNYSGNGQSGRAITHNLGAVPQLMWIKARDANEDWIVYSEGAGNTKYMRLNANSAAATWSGAWNNTTPTSSVFTVGNGNAVNLSNTQYIAYLFASVPGVSKIGTYSGNGTSEGNSQDIDCGFSSSARFVLIKSLDSVNGGWQLFDTQRGITGGNDNVYYLDNSSAQVAEDAVEPYASGFGVTRRDVTGNTNTNTSGQTYLFFAIA